MNGGAERGLAARTRVHRYVAACVVAGAAAFVALAADPRVCREEVHATATHPVQVCGPLGATDLKTIAVLGVVLLLLAPDLSEAGIAGVTLKRRVEEAKADAAAARADAAEARLTLNAIRQRVDVISVASATAVVKGDSAELVEAFARLGMLKGAAPPDDRAEGGTAAAATTGAAIRPVSDDGHALLITTAMDGMLGLLPGEWEGATLIGRVGHLLYVTGEDVDLRTKERLGSDGSPLLRAQAGEFAIAAATASARAIVAAPVHAANGEHLGEIAVVLPRGAVADERAALAAIAPVREAFAALAAYARANVPSAVSHRRDGVGGGTWLSWQRRAPTRRRSGRPSRPRCARPHSGSRSACTARGTSSRRRRARSGAETSARLVERTPLPPYRPSGTSPRTPGP